MFVSYSHVEKCDTIPEEQIFCGSKYCHNSIKNDYCSGKLGLVVSRLGLVGSVELGLSLVTSLGVWLIVRVSESISGSSTSLVYRCNSQF